MQIANNKYALSLGFFFLLLAPWLSASPTLDAVRERGYLSCGVSTGLPGFSAPTKEGKWYGLDVDFCRAVAAATLGNADKVRFIPLTAKERFEALQSGLIDILSRNSSWTLNHEVRYPVVFTGVLYFDGQGFMVNTRRNIESVQDLKGATVCVKAATTSTLHLDDFFAGHQLDYQPLVLDTKGALIKAFDSGRCDVLSSDQSQLYGLRTLLKEPGEARIFPELISKELLGPVVRRGDDSWQHIVQWTLFTLINGEELGIRSDNVDFVIRYF